MIKGVPCPYKTFFQKQTDDCEYSGEVFVKFEDWLEVDKLRTEDREFLELGDIMVDYYGENESPWGYNG